MYLNHVGSIPRFFRKRIKPRENPTKSVFLLNVSRDENRNVFVVSDFKLGYHWSICNVDSIAKFTTYGDCMGQVLPDRLSETVGDFVKALWGKVHPHNQWFAATIPSRVLPMANLWPPIYLSRTTHQLTVFLSRVNSLDSHE